MSTAVATTPAVLRSRTPDVPPILSLLDRPTLRLLAAWSPAVSGMAQPSSAGASPAPLAASVPSSSVVSHPSSSVPSSSVVTRPSSSVPEPRTPDPEPRPFFPLLCARSGLTEPQARAAYDLARAHDLIHPDGSLNPHAKDLLDTRSHRVTAFARRRRLLINRANAAKSTGPRTDAGKAVAALNGLKHGLTAQLPVLPTENELLYVAHHRALQDEYQPAGPTEILLVDQLAHLAWRLRRAHLAEAELNHHTNDHEARPGIAILQACESHILPKLDRHLTALSRAFTRTLHELQELQGARHNVESDNDIGQDGFVLKNEKITGDDSLLALVPDLPPRAPAPSGALPDLLSSPPPAPFSATATPHPPVTVLVPSLPDLPSVLGTADLPIGPSAVTQPSSSAGVPPASAVPEPRTPNPETRPSRSSPCPIPPFPLY